MKFKILILVIVGLYQPGLKAQPFYKYFSNNTLRVDFSLCGDSSQTHLYINRVLCEPGWGGRINNLTESPDFGSFAYTVADAQSGEKLFEGRFCTLFQEWQTTKEAAHIPRAFTNTILMPFPNNNIYLTIIQRKNGFMTDTLIHLLLDPKSPLITPLHVPAWHTKTLLKSGNPHECVDIAILAEGYTANQMDKFWADAQRFADALFTSAPFSLTKNRFNIYAVACESAEEDVDIPYKNQYRNTALNCSYSTFYTDRYLTTSDMEAVHNAASLVPYDQICILANTGEYGGGGIFNFFSVFSAGGTVNAKVFIHEFGHAFAGLADEYYSSSVAYSNFYPKNTEPWEPNT